jgi:CheY-like chemotaxis protein
MAGAIAHHFNNQLQAVMLNLEIALDDLPPDTARSEPLAEAMKSAAKAAEVSSLMLTYLGQSMTKHVPMDLSEACRKGMPLLRTAAPPDVLIETDLPAPGPMIQADPNQIQQVLTSLITNAWEACGGRAGVLRLGVRTVGVADLPASANRVPLDVQQEESPHACLEVTDTGCGIPPQDLEKLFDPFFSTKFTGRGMGLPVVLGVVRSHNGFVTVESALGKGSTFKVFFPLSSETLATKPPPVGKGTVSNHVRHGATVLLVEDEPIVRASLSLVLKRSGFVVFEAEDGVKALDVFTENLKHIDCVVCDLTMPRMNGWEALAAMRRLSPGIPVILASGYNESQAMQGEHPEQPSVFVHKPYNYKALIGVIRHTLAGA